MKEGREYLAQNAKKEGVVVTPMPGATPPPAPEPAATSWLARLHARGGVLLDVCTPELPAALERMAAARDVLLSAGVCRRARVGEAEYLAFGFPDLDRPASRVLLVRDAWPHPEVVALHRESTGVVAE